MSGMLTRWSTVLWAPWPWLTDVLTLMITWDPFLWNYLGPFSVKEEEEDLSKDLLRLEVNFGEVLEEKEEDAALVDFLSQLHL